MSSPHIRHIYRRESLRSVLRAAQRTPMDANGHAAFAEFHRDTLHEAFDGIRFDGLLVTTSFASANLLPEEVSCITLDVGPSILDSYKASKAPDPFFPLVHKYPGRAIHNLSLVADEEWRKSKLYTDHCRRFDIYRFLRIGVKHPGKDRHFVSIDYVGGETNLTWDRYDLSHFELVSFPFILAWLYRYGALDYHRLEKYLERLADLTASQLTYLRKYVNSPWQDLTSQAADLGYSAGGYKQSLYALRDSLHDRLRLPDQIDPDDTFKSLRILEYAYRFLIMLGDPVRPKIISLAD